MMNRRLVWLATSLLVLAGAIFAQSIFSRRASNDRLTLPADVLPAKLPGVTVTDLKIAETELMSRAIEEGLGFNDYRYREYRKGGSAVTVYLAYWPARRRHFMEIGTHAPDNCWVSSGWTMAPKLPKQSFELNDGRRTWPAESRIFRSNGSTVYVAYWHLVDGQPVDYTHYGKGKTVGYLLDNLRYYWHGTDAQYFLRISSNLPIDRWAEDLVFRKVLASLAAQIPIVQRSPSEAE